MTPAVVVLGYDRPQSLLRLLASLDAAVYPPDEQVPLVISLDRANSGAGEKTAAVAHDFAWRFGPKRVLTQPAHLGVVGHFRAAGALTREYGDIVLLEDDLGVGPAFYDYACQMLAAYRDDERVAAHCLYALWFNGFTREPFLPLEDGADVFFVRVPYTQGLCFSAAQWASLEAWLDDSLAGHPGLHSAFLRFGPDEWSPRLAAGLAGTGRFFSFPRVSHTIGWGDAGAHFAQASAWFQTPLMLARRRLHLLPLNEALAVYDGFFELLPNRFASIAPALQDRTFEVDLNATKQRENLASDLVLTARPVRQAEARFGLAVYPPELNVAMQVRGSDIALARSEDVQWGAWAEAEARRRLHAYYWRRNQPSRSRALRFAAARAIERIRSLRSR